MKNRIKTAISKKIILIGIGLVALYWVLESVVMATIFDEGSFVEQLFIPDAHEAWMRFLGMGIIVAFGLYGQAILAGRKREKRRLQTTYHFLEIANRHRRMTPMLKEYVSVVKEFTGCDSAGIRILGEEGNIPYQAYVGFSQEFYDSESSLSIKLDRCMCINVIKGATEPKLPYYTQVGSFYTNSNTRLLARTSEAERGPTRNVCNLHGYETVVLVPINLAGRILGLIHVADHREGMVTLEMVEALEEVAIQLGTAIQRVWAEEELQESEERNRALLDLGTEVGESVVMLQDTERGEGIQTFVSYMWPHITGYPKEELLGMSFFNLVHPESRQTSIERHRKKMAGKSMPGLYELSIVRKDGTEVPVELTSTSTTYKGQRANVVFIRDITERKRAEEQLRGSREQLRALSAHLQSAREEERKRIAREVHDELGQVLTGLKMDLSWLGKRLLKDQTLLLEKTKAMSGLVDNTMETVRRISTELRPGLLDDLGLIAAVEWHAEEFKRLTGIRCRITSNCDGAILDQDLSTAVFRIFQETLLNVARHTRATRVKASLMKENGSLVMEISDNGKGITREDISNPKSLGLVGMRERALLWGGEVDISGVQGKGTTVTVHIPLNGEGAA